MVQVREVVKVFDGKEVLRHLNMSVERGTIYGLLGANGVGKSTTFKLISGLLQPNAGAIQFDGEEIQVQDRKFLKEMGILIETPVFYEHLSARENLEIHLAYMGCKSTAIDNSLQMVGLADTGKKPVSKFSLGMKQRLAIARAISHSPKLLVLDEPVNGLDPMGIRQMRELFLALVKDYDMTVLISSHILSEIEYIADRVGVLVNGSIAREVPMSEVREICPEGLEDYFVNIMSGGTEK